MSHRTPSALLQQLLATTASLLARLGATPATSTSASTNAVTPTPPAAATAPLRFTAEDLQQRLYRQTAAYAARRRGGGGAGADTLVADEAAQVMLRAALEADGIASLFRRAHVTTDTAASPQALAEVLLGYWLRGGSSCGAGSGGSGPVGGITSPPGLEPLIANVLATRLGLPTRFHWPLNNPQGASRALLSGSAASTAVQRMLWAPAQRTGGGGSNLTVSSNATDAKALFAFTPQQPPARGHRPAAASMTSSAQDTAQGGGALHTSALESYLVLLHTIRAQALHRCSSSFFTGREEEERQRQRPVLYASDQCDALLLRAARLAGWPHVRVLQTIAGTTPAHGYGIRLADVQAQMAQDLASGLFPAAVVGVFGARTSGAVDALEELAAFCCKTGVWFHVDASHGGLALLDQSPTGSSAEAADPRVAALRRATETADSLFLSVHEGYLPFSLLPPGLPAGGAVLFLAHTAKTAVALQQLEESRTADSMNQCVTLPAGGSSSGARGPSEALHLTPVQERGAALVAWAYHVGHAPPPSSQRPHRSALQEVQRRLQSDGRFDLPLDTALFGMLLLRFTTLADQSVEALALALDELLASEAEGGAAAPVALRVGLVVLQKRMWLSLSISAVHTESAAAAAAVYVSARVCRAADVVAAAPLSGR